jgi:MSHA biogenesis protein MshK
MSRLLLCAMSVLMPSAAQSAPFADPTRPPNANAVDSGIAPVAAGGPRLESVLIAPDRRVAVISGQQVRLGDKFGDGRVVQITASEVVIRGAEATETLKLFPAAEKRLRAPRDKGPLR